MSDAALWLYHRLPAPARSAVASLRGYYLRRWRYGPETDRLIAEALDRDHWTTTQWDRAREERLVYVLQRAATRVPYYRALWQARRRRGDRSSWEDLANWPLLEKEAVRAQPEAFLADGCRPRRLGRVHTSRTPRKSVPNWPSREGRLGAYAPPAAPARP